MGKTRNKPETKADKTAKPLNLNRNQKKVAAHTESMRIGDALRSVELPTSSEGLTADQLTADQKTVFKKHCQNMYGHKYSTKRKLPAHSLEAATVQLAAKMKEKAEQLKRDKKNRKK